MRFNEFLGWVEYCTFGLGGGVGVGFIVAATVAMFTSEILRFALDARSFERASRSMIPDCASPAAAGAAAAEAAAAETTESAATAASSSATAPAATAESAAAPSAATDAATY